MNHKRYHAYLEHYTLEALNECGDDVSLAADYLAQKPLPSLFTNHRREKKAALKRVRRVFAESRERSLYVVLKSLGFDDLAKEKI